MRWLDRAITHFHFACAGTLVAGLAGSTAAQTVSDSAGVRIVTYEAADRPSQRWRIGGTPLLALGGAEAAGPTQFFRIVGVVRLTDGSIAVGDGSSREIRIFDVTGAHLHTLGGRGYGPGEFSSLWGLWRVGDSLVGVDGVGRAQLFAADGRHLAPLRRPVSTSGERIRRYGYLGDGRGVGAWYQLQEELPAGPSTGLMTLAIMDGESTIERVIGQFPARQVVRDGRGRISGVIYGPRGHIAVMATGFCVGYSEQYSFRCYDASGGLRTVVVREGWRSRRVTEEDCQIFFDGIDKANPGPRGARYRKEVEEITKFAERFPPYGRFVGSTADELWVGSLVPADETLGTLNPSPPDPTVWSVYSVDGEWLSDVTLPARFRLMEAGADYVAGVARDATDVERVVVYPLLRE